MRKYKSLCTNFLRPEIRLNIVVYRPITRQRPQTYSYGNKWTTAIRSGIFYAVRAEVL
jgi:hypothetical protein